MQKQILVSLRRSDRIEEILPYVEQIAQPGMKVVFLVHCGFRGFQDLLDQLLAVNAGITPAHLPGKNTRDSWQSRKHFVREEVLCACTGLTNGGIKIGVNVYAGRLAGVVREFIANEDIDLVLMGPRAGDRLRNLLRKMGPLAPLFKAPVFSPVLLLHPNHTVER